MNNAYVLTIMQQVDRRFGAGPASNNPNNASV